MAKRPLVNTNAQALRWCRTRRAHIEFGEWLVPKTAPKGVSCRIKLGNHVLAMYGKTLIKAVNAWIKHFNKQQETDIE